MIHFPVINAPLPTMNLLKKFWALQGRKNEEDYCKMYLASEILTLLDIVCKNTEKICQEFGFDLGYCFLTPHLMMDLILKVGKEEIGVIADMDQHLFVERSTRGVYVFHRNCILVIYPTGQRTAEKSDVVFLDMNFLYRSVMSNNSLTFSN